jgi:hypothetical protein
MYVRDMTDEPDVLEQLRTRLAHLQARQRAAGGTAEPGLWSRVATAPPEGSSPPALGGSGPRRRGQRRLAPHARPSARRAGPWAQLPAAPVVPSAAQWVSESDMEDPGWLAAVAARADAEYAAQPTSPDSAGGPEAEDPTATPDEAPADPRPVDAGQSDSRDRPLDRVPLVPAQPEVPGGSGIGGEPVAVLAEALVGMSLHAHPEAELSRAAQWIAAARAGQEVMLVNVVAELESRGTQTPDGLSRTDWLRALDPTLSAAAARALVRVGRAFAQPRWAELRALVSTQQVAVAHAAQVVEFTERTGPVADPDELAAAVADVLAQAPSLREEELRVLIRQHTEQVRPPRDDDAAEEGRRQARGLWLGPPNPAGMVTLRGLLDPEAAAVLTAAVDPLSVPCPTRDGHGHLLEPDPRSPARRRADALLEVVARGVAAADGVPSTDKTKVVVLIDHDTLTGQVRGTGTTLSGDVLTAETVRRLACDAGIIPVVLGGQSEPLDVGRERRLVTKGLRLALTTRDRGCSYPGCTIPPHWTDAHHVTHWARGGTTSLTNTALLCRRHHTHVHRHDLTADVTATGVTWHV